MFAKESYLAKIGSWTEALAAFDEIIAKEKTSTGKKIDATMKKAKISLFIMVYIDRFAEFEFWKHCLVLWSFPCTV